MAGKEKKSLTKNYKTAILITNYTYENLEDKSKYFLRPVDRVRVKGKSKVVTLYEVMDASAL